MPISDFTSKLLELEDVIISDLHTTNTEVHVFFSLKRKPNYCPHCGSITQSVHDYRSSVLKDLPLWAKKPSSITAKDAITAPTVTNIFMNPFLYFPNIAGSLPGLLFMPSIY